MKPYVGVNAISEVDNRGALREVEQITLGRKDIKTFGKKIILQAVQELLGILEILLPFQQLAQPGVSLYVTDVKIFSFFITPVRRDSFLRYSMHLVSPDLDFHSFAVWTDHTGMQRLIHIRLGHRDI